MEAMTDLKIEFMQRVRTISGIAKMSKAGRVGICFDTAILLVSHY